MNTHFYFTVLSVCLVIIGLIARFMTPKRRFHWKMRRESRSAYKKLSRLDDTDQKLTYLRTLHHFAFEELILHAFKKMGWSVTRNSSYTGDGGIDGEVFYKGERYLIQAKRYTGTVRVKDVEDFYRVTILKKCKGFFIHTGKTPKTVNTIRGLNDKITFIYGKSLVDFLDGTDNSNG